MSLEGMAKGDSFNVSGSGRAKEHWRHRGYGGEELEGMGRIKER